MQVLDNSFVRFVYPFLFDAEQFGRRSQQIEAATYSAGKGDAKIWMPQPIDESGLLPYVASYLNTSDSTATARLWEMEGNARQSPHCLGAESDIAWHFVREKKWDLRFHIEKVQLLLFRVGVGFLTVRIKPEIEPDAEGSNLRGWLDFLHFFRFLRRSRSVYVRAERREFDPATRTESRQPYFPSLAGGPPLPDSQEQRVFFDVVRGLLQSGMPAGQKDRWWRDVFIAHQALPYAALFIQGAAEPQQRRLLYKVHNFFHSTEGEHPAPCELEFDQPHLIPYAERQWFVFSLDGGAFVAFDPPDTPFFRDTLPDHLDTRYLLVYLLALHQRFALMGLTEDVSQHWLAPPEASGGAADLEREKVFRRIRDTLLAFTARGYFAQVMQRRHHHRCYQKWQEIFQVERLFREVSDEVREMHDYLQMRKTEQLQRLAEEQKQQVAEQQRQLEAATAERRQQAAEQQRQLEAAETERQRQAAVQQQQLELAAREQAQRDRRAQKQAERFARVLNLIAAFLAIPLLLLSWQEAGGSGWMEALKLEGVHKALATFAVLLVGFLCGSVFMWAVHRERRVRAFIRIWWSRVRSFKSKPSSVTSRSDSQVSSPADTSAGNQATKM